MYNRCKPCCSHCRCVHFIAPNCCEDLSQSTWSFNVGHEGTGNDCCEGRQFAMTKSIWPHLSCLRLGAKRCFRNNLQQSHAGLSVQTESSMTRNKHLTAQAASSDLCPPPEKNGALRLLSLNLTHYRWEMRIKCSRLFWLVAANHRIIAASRLQALIFSCVYRPLTGVESNRKHGHSQALAWSLEHDKSYHISKTAQRREGFADQSSNRMIRTEQQPHHRKCERQRLGNYQQDCHSGNRTQKQSSSRQDFEAALAANH